MTAATRDRRSEPDDEELGGVRWNDRAMVGGFRGLPWWSAVLITFVLAVIGTYADVSGTKTVGWVFAVAFFAGAVGAVVFVERRSMFGPVVQPPLVLAIVVPIVVVLTQDVSTGGGLTSMALNLGRPLIDGFPAMALTTACTVALGIYRVSTQKDPNRLTKDEARELRGARGSGDAGEVRETKSKPAKPAKPPRAEKPAAEDRPRRPRPAASDAEDRPKRPRPQQTGGDRPRPPASRDGRSGRPRPRKPRDDD